MPRIIAGRIGGLLLNAPEGKDTRPTADRTKEGMFSALGARLSFEGLKVLDLFSGSGQLGIEALSRGAEHCVFVEQSNKSLAVLKENLKRCRLQEQAEVRKGDVFKVMQTLAREGRIFDLILMDPPYAEAWPYLLRLENLLQNTELFQKNGLLVLESDAKAPKQGDLKYLQMDKSCKYGTAMVSFYRNPEHTEL